MREEEKGGVVRACKIHNHKKAHTFRGRRRQRKREEEEAHTFRGRRKRRREKGQKATECMLWHGTQPPT